MWFSAEILFETEIEGDNDPLQEESVRLVEANDIEEAWQKAGMIGRAHRVEYQNESGELVRWKFVEVLKVRHVWGAEFSEGMEVFSRLKWKSGRPLVTPDELSRDDTPTSD